MKYLIIGVAIITLSILLVTVIKYFLNRKSKTLPYGAIYESSGGLQCCCPVCAYGIGTQDTFIENYSKLVVRVCKTCGTEYRSLTIGSVPTSGRLR